MTTICQKTVCKVQEHNGMRGKNLDTLHITGGWAVADPGFLKRGGGGGANFQGGGKNLLFGQIFPQKLHENKIIWTGGGRESLRSISVEYIKRWDSVPLLLLTIKQISTLKNTNSYVTLVMPLSWRTSTLALSPTGRFPWQERRGCSASTEVIQMCPLVTKRLGKPQRV